MNETITLILACVVSIYWLSRSSVSISLSMLFLSYLLPFFQFNIQALKHQRISGEGRSWI
jgi:hypothetical protein